MPGNVRSHTGSVVAWTGTYLVTLLTQVGAPLSSACTVRCSNNNVAEDPADKILHPLSQCMAITAPGFLIQYVWNRSNMIHGFGKESKHSPFNLANHFPSRRTSRPTKSHLLDGAIRMQDICRPRAFRRILVVTVNQTIAANGHDDVILRSTQT